MIRPFKTNNNLTVTGNVSTSNLFYDISGNSSQWNSVYSLVNKTTATTFNVNNITAYGAGSFNRGYINTNSGGDFYPNISICSSGGTASTITFCTTEPSNWSIGAQADGGSDVVPDRNSFTILDGIYYAANGWVPQSVPLILDSNHNFCFNGYTQIRNDGTIIGGVNNISNSSQSPIVGGVNNILNGNFGFIGGGYGNKTDGNGGNQPTIVGGYFNCACGDSTFVGGGVLNTASGYYQSVVVGGGSNCASADHSFIGGGIGNKITSNGGIIVGGNNNCVFGDDLGFIGGGEYNCVGTFHGFIGGGNYNCAGGGDQSTVVGGYQNKALNDSAFVGGGRSNTASGYASFVGGGASNKATNQSSIVVGGNSNTASGYYSTVAGGCCNIASGDYSFIGGGYTNIIVGKNSVIAGGSSNTTLGNNSSIAGGNQNTVGTALYSIVIAGAGATSDNGTYTASTNTLGTTFISDRGQTLYYDGGNWFIGSDYYITTNGKTLDEYVGSGFANFYYGINPAPTLNSFTINVSSNNSFIAAGSANNTFNFDNTFILGSNLSANQANFTYVNNLSSQGLVSASGGNSNQWNIAYKTATTYQTASSSFITAVSGTTNQINASKTGSTVTLSFPNSAVFPGDVSIIGNLTLAGSSTYIDTKNLVVGDNLIYFNDNNYGSNVLDIGIVAHFTQAPLGYNHTGLVRRAGQGTPGTWTLFSGLTTEPLSAANIDWTDRNIVIDSLSANLIGNVTGNITGNAATVTNGVYTTGSYSNPSWITSIQGSIVSGNISGQSGSVANGVYTTGSYADPSWITSLADTKISGTKFATNTNLTNYLPLSGGTLTGLLSTNNSFNANGYISTSALRITTAANTFTNPVTASGSFLIVNINGTNKAIQLWDYSS